MVGRAVPPHDQLAIGPFGTEPSKDLDGVPAVGPRKGPQPHLPLIVEVEPVERDARRQARRAGGNPEALTALAPAVAEIAILMDVCLVEKDHEMLVALGSREQVSNALDERLSPLRVGPAQQLLGFLPRQLEAVQGRADRLATAPQPEPLAGPRDKAAQRPARRWTLRRLGAASRPCAERRGSSRRVRLCGAGKKGTAAAGSAERKGVGTVCVVSVYPAQHGLGMASRARSYARSAPALRALEERESALTGAGVGRAQGQGAQALRCLTPARVVNTDHET